jgi:probable rRNA maturation factor
MIDVDDRAGAEYDLRLIEKIHTLLTDRDVELILTDNAQIKLLNKDFRNIDKPTDVLSFPLEDVPFAPLGMIVISVDKVKEKAAELGHHEEEELALLYLHGLLHLLGYDHESDAGEMRAKEAEVIRSLGLPDSLILRTK